MASVRLSDGPRALLQDAAQVSPAHYRRFWRQAQLQAMLPDLLVRGEPYLTLNALVLTEQDRGTLERLTAVFSEVFHRAGQRVATDVPLLIELGFPWAAAELLAREAPRLPIIGRFDFVADMAGMWQLLELNADTPSGVREAVVCDRLVHEMLPEACNLIRLSEPLGDALCAATLRALAVVPAGGALGLVTTASELEDLSQMAYTARLLQPALATRGIEVVLGDAGNLRLTRAGLTLRGRRISALYRYLPFEAIFGTPTFIAMEEAVAEGRATILNGLYGLLLQNKGLLGWIWAHRTEPGLFSPEARAAIERHLPATWPIEEVPSSVPREALVAKQVFGREGQEVFFGEDSPPELWAALVGRRTYIAQRRVRVAQTRAVVQTSLGPELREGHATVGCFAVNGRFAGCYTRFGEKIITSRSKWLATFSAPGAEPGVRDG